MPLWNPLQSFSRSNVFLRHIELMVNNRNHFLHCRLLCTSALLAISILLTSIIFGAYAVSKPEGEAPVVQMGSNLSRFRRVLLEVNAYVVPCSARFVCAIA